MTDVEREHKRLKTDTETTMMVSAGGLSNSSNSASSTTTTILAEFQTMDGSTVEEFGGQINIPSGATSTQLTQLVNKLLGNGVEEKFAFYVNETPLPNKSDIFSMVRDNNMSTENRGG